jgi:hypothetical protein
LLLVRFYPDTLQQLDGESVSTLILRGYKALVFLGR